MQTLTTLPVLEFDWYNEKIRQIATNIYHAQQEGWPKVLTYDAERDAITRRRKRNAAMVVTLEDVQGLPGADWIAKEIEAHGRLEIPTIRSIDPNLNFPSRDEYPFACTKEHEGTAWIGHVSPKQNSLQGYMISAFLKQHAAEDGFRFEVRVKFPMMQR